MPLGPIILYYHKESRRTYGDNFLPLPVVLSQQAKITEYGLQIKSNFSMEF